MWSKGYTVQRKMQPARKSRRLNNSNLASRNAKGDVPKAAAYNGREVVVTWKGHKAALTSLAGRLIFLLRVAGLHLNTCLYYKWGAISAMSWVPQPAPHQFQSSAMA